MQLIFIDYNLDIKHRKIYINTCMLINLLLHDIFQMVKIADKK